MNTVLVVMAAYVSGVLLLIAGAALAFNLGGAADRAARSGIGAVFVLGVWRQRLQEAAEHAWYWRIIGVLFLVVAAGTGLFLVMFTKAS